MSRGRKEIMFKIIWIGRELLMVCKWKLEKTVDKVDWIKPRETAA